MEKYRLQLYDNGSLGYLGIDGDKTQNFNTRALVISTQGEDEDRESFIRRNRLNIGSDVYGYDERLDRIVNDPDADKETLIMRKYGLGKLVYDENVLVRMHIAQRGYYLDILINDSDYEVRREVAGQRYNLSILINDKEWQVRAEVADQGYGLDRLIRDPHPGVRREVALQGYGLDILYADPNADVREAVKEYLDWKGLTLNEWIKQNIG